MSLNFLENPSLRSIALSLLMGVVGYAGHQIIESVHQQTVIDQHTTQLQQLEKIIDSQQHELQANSLAMLRIEGKVDVVNQKLDDLDEYTTTKARK